MKRRWRSPLLALGLVPAALLWVSAARADEHARSPARRVHAPLPGTDGVYGRFDGTLTFAVSVGAELERGEPRGAFKLSGHYWWTAGAYARYSDAFGRAQLRPARVASLGVDLRPLFLPRFALDVEHGPAWLDLVLDSFSLNAGAYFAQPSDRWLGDVRGFETGLGVAFPVCADAHGFWLEARAERRFADHGDNVWLLTLSVAYHALASLTPR